MAPGYLSPLDQTRARMHKNGARARTQFSSCWHGPGGDLDVQTPVHNTFYRAGELKVPPGA